MSRNHAHDYQKLNDEAVFCRGCGDIKTVAPPVCTLPHYPVWYPYWTWTTPQWPTWTPTITSGQTSITYESTDDGSTWTVP